MVSFVRLVTIEASKDLFNSFRRHHTRLDKAVEFGHHRWEHIDRVMLEEEGEEVRDWWIRIARNQPYKSLVRRMIWERFVNLLTKEIRQAREKQEKRNA